MERHVKGVLFRDYVRMLRAHPNQDWSRWLSATDTGFLQQTVEVEAWYPMDTFERMGLAILDRVADGRLELVKQWGRTSVAHLSAALEQLVVPGDPRDSIMRLQAYRRSLFDFEALAVPELSDGLADLHIAYGMSPLAEEAAATQTLGFFEGLVELADGVEIEGAFLERSWAGDARTRARMTWAVFAPR